MYATSGFPGRNEVSQSMIQNDFANRYPDYWSQGVWIIPLQLEGTSPPASLNLSVVALPSESVATDFLSLVEQEEYSRFQYPRRRNSYLLGKLAAKLALARGDDELSAIAVDHGILNQPIASGRSSKVTVTHSDTLGAALAYDQRLLAGIDLELINEQARDAMLRITSAEEEGLVRRLGTDIAPTAFLTILWTAKEAISKVLQTGFTVAMELFEVKSLERNKYGVVGSFRHFPQLVSVSVVREDYVFSMVLPAKALAEGEEFRILELMHNRLPVCSIITVD
ncbi:4'-phosphopantetheinyl transferase superfamily protein [Paenibacillus lutimineralis]|uniref:4'-phosphopantetheinyl transferase superfamily protein n=2 Tax=Paenibacillus lutimineralis TaxID=2707005 RepID=A0A3Q9I727_9BACL|nr:4'-phosphopantetheinyl transferase superfamily protein [Paenibacillus lutimineralis]